MAQKNPLRSKRTSAFVQQRGLCFYCGRAMWNHSPAKFATRHSLTLEQAQLLKCTAEHLRARKDGGSNARENLVAACRMCNERRHQLSEPPEPAQYLRYVAERVASGAWHG